MNVNDKKWMTCLVRVLLLGAAAVAAYLGFASAGAPVAGCGDGSSCSDLLASKWSKALGVPVAFLGMAAYLALAVLVDVVARRSNGALGNLGLVLMVVIPSVAAWFLVVQLFIVHAICPWCCLAHALAVLAVALLFGVRLSRPAAPPYRRGNAASAAFVPAASALVVLGFIAVSGLGKTQRGGVLTAQLDSPLKRAESRPADDAPYQHVGTAIELHGGEIAVWPAELPGFGSAKAENMVVLITDFTCEHCRSLHAVLDTVSQLYGNQLGVVILPATRSDESALIQRVALTLHRENPDLYRALARSLGSGELEANASAVTNEAVRLVGAERLELAMKTHRDWVDDQLVATRELRAANAEASGRSTLPQLIVGDEVIYGAHPSPGYYVNLLQTNFDLIQVAVIDQAVGAGSGDERPALELSSRRVDLGKVRPGDVLNVSVPYENTGDGPLVFNWVKTQPGVAVADLPAGEIDPGGKGEIGLNIRIPSELGAMQRSLVIHSNAHLEGLALKITATVAAGDIQQVNAADGEPE